MGIEASFIIKHVRPLGEDAYNRIASQEFTTFLAQVLHLSLDQIVALLAAWRRAALADPQTNSAAFVEAATAVTAARWGELYPTSASTVMFLTATQLASLSQTGQTTGANQNFGWRTREGIQIAVTLRRGGGTHIRWDVPGFYGATNGAGNVVHFEELMP